MKDYIRKWIIISDLQVPYHDIVSLDAVEQYIADERWDGYLNIGDFLDIDCISSFNKDAPRRTEGKRILSDYDIANAILDRHQKMIRKKNPDAKFVYLEGNHEERIERFLDGVPQLQGFFEIEKGLRLKERDITWVRSWSKGETYSIGKAMFTHGLYTNQYHAKKMVDAWGQSIFYGHTHDMMAIPRTHKGKSDIIVGQSIGCLCEYGQAYMKGKPSNWQQGFMVLFLLPNGNYTYYTPRIFDHQFIGPNGKLYVGRKQLLRNPAFF